MKRRSDRKSGPELPEALHSSDSNNLQHLHVYQSTSSPYMYSMKKAREVNVNKQNFCSGQSRQSVIRITGTNIWTNIYYISAIHLRLFCSVYPIAALIHARTEPHR